MNWFERYGVVGTYFLTNILIWFLSFTSYTILDAPKFMKIYIFIFLPLGYILCIFSQFLYYLGVFGERIHRIIVKDMLDKSIKDYLTLTECSDEATCESRLTAYARLNHSKKEEVRSLISFARRRFDTLAINNSIILYTFLSPITTIIIIFIFCPDKLCINWQYSFFILSASSLLISILNKSKETLKNQILEINKYAWGEEKRAE